MQLMNRFLVVAVVVLFALHIGAQADQPASAFNPNQACYDMWEQSDAHDECGSQRSGAANGLATVQGSGSDTQTTNCKIQTRCPKGPAGSTTGPVQFNGSAVDVLYLYSCGTAEGAKLCVRTSST